LTVVAVLGIGLVWIAVTGLLARHDEDTVRAELSTLRSDLEHSDEAGAARLEVRMRDQAAAAHARTSGPAWWLAAQLPSVGAPLRTIRGATGAVDQLAGTALPAALKAGEMLDPAQLRQGPGQIDPQRLGAAAAPLGQAVDATDSVLSRVQRLPSSTWLGAVDNNRDSLVSDVTRLRRGLADLSTAARLLPDPLGETGTKRYFVAFQTDAEARGLGGLPGAYAILQAQDGRLSFVRFGSDTDLNGARAHVALGADYDSEFDDAFGPKTYFGNSDPSPHFPYAAAIWMSMWEDKFHQHLDGAIATDPTTLGYLLGAVGSVTLSDGTVLDGSNAESFLESGVYTKFPSDNEARKAYQVEAAKAVTSAVLNQPSGDLLASATALQRAADEGRLLLYTTDPTVEGALQSEPVGGILPETDQPFLDVVINNGGGNKLDYYLDRTVTYRRTGCAAGKATVTVTLHNGAPTSGLPPVVVGAEGVAHPKQAGDNDLLVSVYDTNRSSVTRATLDGKTAFFDTEHERGHPVTIADVPIRAGQTRTLVLTVREPAASGPLIALRQPLVRPLKQTISMPVCRS
jgi:hypothetical protein